MALNHPDHATAVRKLSCRIYDLCSHKIFWAIHEATEKANVEIQTSRALCPCPKGKPHHAILGHFSLFRKLICFLGTKNSGQESRTWISLELLLYGAVKMQLKY